TSAMPKTTLGQSFVKPSERPSAVAQTASRTPDAMRMIQGSMIDLSASLVARRVLVPLVREPQAAARRQCARRGWAIAVQPEDAAAGAVGLPGAVATVPSWTRAARPGAPSTTRVRR